MKTTLIGSYPKPEYIKFPDWFRTGNNYIDLVTNDGFKRFVETLYGRRRCNICY